MKKKFLSVLCFVATALLITGWNNGEVVAQDAAGEKGVKPGERPAGGESAKGELGGVPDVSTSVAEPKEDDGGEKPAEKKIQDEKSPQTYVMRLRSLSERISTLKERVSQTKYRLSLLKEAVLHGTIAGAQLKVVQEHKMGSSFRLESIRYALNGKGIYGKEGIADTKLAKTKNLPIFSGPIPPGPHVLTVELKWRGHGHGVFSYLRGYKFRVLSSHSFKATEGTETVIKVRAYEKGNMSTQLKDRPAVKFVRQTRVVQPKRKVEGAAESGKAEGAKK